MMIEKIVVGGIEVEEALLPTSGATTEVVAIVLAVTEVVVVVVIVILAMKLGLPGAAVMTRIIIPRVADITKKNIIQATVAKDTL